MISDRMQQKVTLEAVQQSLLRISGLSLFDLCNPLLAPGA